MLDGSILGPGYLLESPVVRLALRPEGASLCISYDSAWCSGERELQPAVGSTLHVREDRVVGFSFLDSALVARDALSVWELTELAWLACTPPATSECSDELRLGHGVTRGQMMNLTS